MIDLFGLAKCLTIAIYTFVQSKFKKLPLRCPPEFDYTNDVNAKTHRFPDWF